MNTNNELAKVQPQSVGVFNSSANFEHAQRIAKMLCASSLVPETYQNNMANTLVALEMSNRIGASPLMVMQNLNVIHGRPSWSSPFIIASINSCGRFAPLRFVIQKLGKKKIPYTVWTGEKPNRRKETKEIEVDDISCMAWTIDASGERLEGPTVSIEMAVLEGWYTKSDSKWKTMPEVMLRYRAAAFFGRLYAPEIMLGMHTSEELHDVDNHVDKTVNPVESINVGIKSQQPAASAVQPPAEEAVVVSETPAEGGQPENGPLKPSTGRRKKQDQSTEQKPPQTAEPAQDGDDGEYV